MPAFPILQDTRVEHCSGYTWSLESSEAARLWFNHCQSGETKQVIETSSARQPIAVSDISIYICLIDIRSKSKEQLNERRAGLSSLIVWR